MTRDLSIIDTLVVHHAKTPDGSSHYTAADIDDWHRERGFRRQARAIELFQPQFRSIGYHGVILVSGEFVAGRSDTEIGAHAEGINHRSIGICMMGTARFTAAQWNTLARVVYAFTAVYGGDVIGHRDHNPAKVCPGFDVTAWLSAGKVPDPSHLFESR